MMKKIMTLLIVSMLCLTGCALMNKTPSDSVKKFLNNYKNNDKVVVDELNDYLTTEELSDDEMKDYREIYLRQYSNMNSEIKNERIDGDKAEVEVQITVYDYYKTNKASGEYLTANRADFVSDDGDIDLTKYLSYKISKLLDEYSIEKSNFKKLLIGSRMIQVSYGETFRLLFSHELRNNGFREIGLILTLDAPCWFGNRDEWITRIKELENGCVDEEKEACLLAYELT